MTASPLHWIDRVRRRAKHMYRQLQCLSGMQLMQGLIAKSKFGVYDGCRAHEDVVARYERLDALVAHLRAGGPFLDQRSLGRVRDDRPRD